MLFALAGMTACFRVLLTHLSAAPDAVDSSGHSSVHWLVFLASDFRDEELCFKPADDRLAAGLETAGVRPGPDESPEPLLWSLFRYRCEPALRVLLAASKSCGYIGDIDDIVAWNASAEAQSVPAGPSHKHRLKQPKRNPSLLDLQDHNGNTALHWAAAHRHVSMVGLLLFHGAAVDIRNNAGLRPFDLVEWDSAEAEADQPSEMKDEGEHGAAASNATSATSATAMLRPAMYSSLTHTYERRSDQTSAMQGK